MSSYRPNYGDGHRGGDSQSRRRSPRRSSPPSTYQFGGGDTYRPGQDSRNFNRYNDRGDYPPRSDRRDEFTFRAPDGPRFSQAEAGQLPPQQRPQRRPNNRGGHNNRGRTPWRPPPAPHSRPILATNRDKTPEQFLGTSEGQSRFIALEDVSDSEAEMDLESNDGEAQDDELPPAKRTRVDDGGDAAPKWSNPDPYTSLPPPDESQTKKKDVVKLIRKAKVAAQQEAEPNAVSQGADFISFDDGAESSSSSSSEDEPNANGRNSGAMPGFSHLTHLHNDITPNTGKSSLPPPSPSVPARLPELPPVSLNQWPPPPPSVPQPPLPGPKGKKRNLDQDTDALPPLPPVNKKRKREGPLDGSLVEEWLPRSGHSSTPWYTVDHSKTESMGLWLHKEISDFYDFVKPHPTEERIRYELVSRLQRLLNQKFAGTVHCFGSFAAGLYLPTADMDLVFMTPDFEKRGSPNFGKKQLFILGSYLRNQRDVRPGSVEIVAGARVPIIKMVDNLTGLKVDISFENDTGVKAIQTFQKWKQDYPAMPVIAMLIKHFLAMRGLNEVFTGGLGGFSIICMVVSLIHQLPARQSGNFVPEQHLGELLLEFLDFYGNRLNINTTRISLNPQEYMVKVFPTLRRLLGADPESLDILSANLSKKGAYALNGKPERPDRISIIDPNNFRNDISVGSHNIVIIQKCFSNAFDALQAKMSALHAADLTARQNQSILGVIFAGDYSSFAWQRERLSKVAESQLQYS